MVTGAASRISFTGGFLWKLRFPDGQADGERNGTGGEKCKVWVCRERFKGKQGKTKHTFAFMRKEIEDEKYKVSVTFASEFLKRNTDSVKCAMENDVFGTLPDNSLLDKLEVDA